MKKVLYYLIPVMLLVVIGIGEIHAQNVNNPAIQDSSKMKRGRKAREKPERSLIRKSTIPVDKKKKTSGNWISKAEAYNESDGRGNSENNPIEISSAEQLAYLALQVNEGKNYAGKYFRLTADINLDGLEWTSIGWFGNDYDDNANRFCGYFSGNGHKIENLTITKGVEHGGLFGVCGKGAYIEKLGVVNCYVKGKLLIGGLVGELIDGSISECYVTGDVIVSNEGAGGMVGINNGTIINSYTNTQVFGNSNDVGGLVGASGDRMLGVIDNCYANGSVHGYWNVGGLAGRSNGVVKNCKATGNVVGEEWVGGLVGWTDKGMITDCSASGNVRGFFDVGGLVGFNGYLKSTVQISNCFATGAVTGNGTGNYCIGGLAGYSGGSVTDCYASGNVSGEESVGGLIGEQGGSLKDSHATGNVQGSFDTGGLVGYNGFTGSRALIENCYATGTVTGFKVFNFGIGGLAGYSGGIISNCYAIGAVSGEEAVGGLAGEQGGDINNCYAKGSVKGKISAGGLVGWNWTRITRSYAAGLVICDGDAGGLVGRNEDADAVVRQSYFDWQSTRQGKGIGLNNNERSSIAIPKTTEELKNSTLPDGFESAVWTTVNGEYPELKVFKK